MKIERIDVLLWGISSQYQVMNHFTLKIFEAIHRAGIPVNLIESREMLFKGIRNPPTFTIGFNGIYSQDGVMMCDLFNIPHLSFMIDPPFRYPHLYESNSKYMILSCDDRDCCTFLDALNFKSNFFLPHAIEPEIGLINSEEDRIYDVVMLASFMNPEKLKNNWKEFYNSEVCALMEKAAETCLNDTTTSYLNFFLKELKVSPTEFDSRIAQPWIVRALKDLEAYIKAQDRVNMLRAVKHPVHIFGKLGPSDSWQAYLGIDNPNYIYHDSVPYNQTINILKKTKILLKSSIKNKNGAHEGIFVALAAGALAVTNENTFLNEYFRNEESILYYTTQSKDLLNEKIHYYLQNEEKRKAIAEAGKAIVLKYHTWDQRVSEIVAQIPKFL